MHAYQALPGFSNMNVLLLNRRPHHCSGYTKVRLQSLFLAFCAQHPRTPNAHLWSAVALSSATGCLFNSSTNASLYLVIGMPEIAFCFDHVVFVLSFEISCFELHTGGYPIYTFKPSPTFVQLIVVKLICCFHAMNLN